MSGLEDCCPFRNFRQSSFRQFSMSNSNLARVEGLEPHPDRVGFGDRSLCQLHWRLTHR
ncbi:MAG: hypothetical protein U5K69_04015 [Balneolaceae bacterium]|nr:hypothetical protein [Balneolaceae bacterium]